MKDKNYIQDITEIKDMMNKSSRFISLSGLSGILAGGYALIGAYISKTIIDNYREQYTYVNKEYALRNTVSEYNTLIINLLIVAITVIVAAAITGIILTYNKAKKHKTKMWDVSSKRLLFHFLFPLLCGGLFSMVLIQKNYYGLVASTTLIFYGLACINASKYTFGDIKYLGIINVILGLIATQYVGYGLYFWAFGFGVMHIFYGIVMHFKYDRK